MWNLSTRPNAPPRQWSQLGEFPDLNSAVRRIIEHRGKPLESLTLSIYVDTATSVKGDREILQSFVYIAGDAFYSIEPCVSLVS
jgi:hypothetical protein